MKHIGSLFVFAGLFYLMAQVLCACAKNVDGADVMFWLLCPTGLVVSLIWLGLIPVATRSAK